MMEAFAKAIQFSIFYPFCAEGRDREIPAIEK